MKESFTIDLIHQLLMQNIILLFIQNKYYEQKISQKEKFLAFQQNQVQKQKISFSWMEHHLYLKPERLALWKFFFRLCKIHDLKNWYIGLDPIVLWR